MIQWVGWVFTYARGFAAGGITVGCLALQAGGSFGVFLGGQIPYTYPDILFSSFKSYFKSHLLLSSLISSDCLYLSFEQRYIMPSS
jgi:hypothetical protein